jgi:hypothetical protein
VQGHESVTVDRLGARVLQVWSDEGVGFFWWGRFVTGLKSVKA